MSGRASILATSVVVCITLSAFVLAQRSQLRELRAQVEQLQPPSAAKLQPRSSAAIADELPPTYTPSLEVLRLRSKVTQLMQQKRALDGVLAENERLRTQITERETGNPGSILNSGGFIRKAEARFVGYATPEAALQSLLWAVHKRDLTNILASFTPEIAEKLKSELQQSGRSPDEFLNGPAALIGMQVVGREESDNGIALQVQIAPGRPPEPIQFRLVNGEWKVAWH